MNTRQPIDSSGNPASLSVTFNQDSSCFSVGLDTGFCVFNSDPCELRVCREFNAGIGAAEMLGKANYMALIGGGKQPKFPQNKVVIWDDHKAKAAITLEFRTPVLRVKLSRTRIVVALYNSIHVYSFASPPEKISVYETADNPWGLCCLGTHILAFPGTTHGQIKLVEHAKGNVSIIPAHSTPLRAIELSPDGEVLATASEKGTLIRIYATSNCARMAELRRGVDPAKIFSLGISPASTFLAVTSDKSTLHVFDLPHPFGPASREATGSKRPSNPGGGSKAANGEENPSQKWGILGRMPLMPRVFSDVYSISSIPFAMGEEPLPRPGSTASFSAIASGMPNIQPPKGVIGWTDEETIIIVGAGYDGRWEKFNLLIAEDGNRILRRDGWKRYLGSN